MRAVRVLAATGVALTLLYGVSLLPGARPHAGTSIFWDTRFNTGVQTLAAAVCLVRAARVPAARGAWLAIGLGLGAYALGGGYYYTYLEFQPHIPYPSWADAGWLGLYPGAVIGVILLARPRVAGSVAGMWLDGLVSGLGLVSVSAAFVFPRVTAGAVGSTAAIVTNFAYPGLDLVLVAVVVGIMAALGEWRDRAWLLLGAGFVVLAAADSIYLLKVAANSYVLGSWGDFTYLAGDALVALAATVRPAPVDTAASGAEQRSFLVPGLFALVALGVLGGGVRLHESTLGVVLAVLALAAAWLRTALTVREVVRLSGSRQQARTDALTGLPNRRAFYELLEEAARPAGDGAAPVETSVLLIDLDRFKEINDGLGHQVGDLVLRAVSQRLAGFVPPGGTIARLGGDEIALLVPGLGQDAAAGLAAELLRALEQPFAIEDMSLHVDASIGVTLLEEGVTGRALAKADLAMYRAKAARTGWEVYDDRRDGDAWDRLAMIEAVREAIGGGGLSVEYQPIVTAAGARPAGVEALLRWTHPVRGRVAPDVFLPLVEHAGLMSAVTRLVLELALDEAGRLRDLGHPIPVSVNLSASDLLDGRLADGLTEALARRGLPPAALRLEITESLLVDSGGGATELLARLRGLGFRLAVDDFGTGYSCLAYLHDLPVSFLKIDRGFTGRLLSDPRTAVIVASTIEMAHRLDLRVVAEGVESAAQRAWLTGHGCDLLQGYHLGTPMPPDALHAWLGTRPAVTGWTASAEAASSG